MLSLLILQTLLSLWELRGASMLYCLCYSRDCLTFCQLWHRSLFSSVSCCSKKTDSFVFPVFHAHFRFDCLCYVFVFTSAMLMVMLCYQKFFSHVTPLVRSPLILCNTVVFVVKGSVFGCLLVYAFTSKWRLFQYLIFLHL